MKYPLIALTLVLAATPLSVAQASSIPARPTLAAPNALLALLKQQITARKSLDFEALLSDWERDYGARAVAPLAKIASDGHAEDTHRYIAIMGMARLGGSGAATGITAYLKDKSWMIRSAALRALRVIGGDEVGPAVLAMLKDPALVVRLEAVETVERLRPTGAARALAETLERGENYWGGKAQWVPQRALGALAYLGAKDTIPRLKPLLARKDDPKLVQQTVLTLESLTGKSFARGASLAEQATAWRKYLD